MAEKVFHKEYPVFYGKTQNIQFQCKKCSATISEDIPIPEKGGDVEFIQCPNCDAEYKAEIFKNEVGGDITVV